MHGIEWLLQNFHKDFTLLSWVCRTFESSQVHQYKKKTSNNSSFFIKNDHWFIVDALSFDIADLNSVSRLLISSSILLMSENLAISLSMISA